MPKIIKDIEGKLLSIAKDIILQEGYDKLSMRRVAAECGIAVGTIYNYFPNKEVMLAGIMVEDWKTCLENADNRITAKADVFEDGLVIICECLEEFVTKYRAIWMQAAVKGGGVPNQEKYQQEKYHPLLRSQIEALIYKLKGREEGLESLPDTLIPLLAEALLAAVMHPDIDKEAVRELGRRVRQG